MGTYTYSRTFQKSEMRRMSCDGFRGDYVSMNWANSGYTGSGDSIALVLPSTVTITMQKVTATWFNNAGGCSYNFYIDLHTTTGTYTSATVNYSWPAGGGTNTIVLTIPGVTGDWTSFDIWGQNWTMSEKKTEYPYVYWFNNGAGTVTVKYETESSAGGSGLMAGEGGVWKNGKYYVWTTHRTRYKYPDVAMTSNSCYGMVASSSTYHSANYQAYKAFNLCYATNCWASSVTTTPQWIQLKMPRALYDIKVVLANRGDAAGGQGPISGAILGSNDGSNFTEIATFSNRDKSSYIETIHVCNNSTVGYSYVRVRADTWAASTYTALGEIKIYGYDVPTTGGWVEAEPFIWKTTGPKTYTYPEAAMTSWFSQGCFACASSDSTSYSAWRAFDKNAANNWASVVNTSDPQPWIQITIPRPLYNISVQINNDSGTAKGPVAGIIYGSNNNGSTLTQIGSFSGRDPAKNVSTTHQCNNSTIAYDTIRITVTTLASGATNVDIGEIYISGTDIGTNGGWAGSYPQKIINFPKAAMTSNKSQDCIVTVSSIYSATYPAFQAFNKNTGSVWASTSSDTQPWIQLTMPIPLYNVVIHFLNANNTKNPLSGKIYGSNDEGASLTELKSFNGYKIATAGAGIVCGNTSTAYNTIRIHTLSMGASNMDIAEIYIVGTQKP